MPVTLEQIEKGLQQISTNMATKSEVISLIDQRNKENEEKQKAIESGLVDANKVMAELKEVNADLISQIKQLRSTRFASIRTPDGAYKGVWGSLELARNFGLFILAEVAGVKAAADQLKAIGIERRYLVGDKIVKGMGGDVGITGGAIIPTEFIPNLIVLMETYGVFRRNAQEWPMSSDSGLAPMQTSDLTVYCPGTGGTITASDIGLKNVGLQALKWATLTAIDSELTEDAAIAVGEVVGRSIARAFAKKEDQCALIGDGTSTYFNILGIAAKLRAVDATVTNIKGLKVQGTAGVWSTIVIGDLLAMTGLLPDYADDGVDAKYYTNKSFYLEVMIARALAAGGAYAQEVVQTGYTRNPFFLGRPVELTSVMPKVKPAVDHCPLIFGNLRLGTYLGDRRMLGIAQSKDVYFASDQIGIRGTERVAISIYGEGDTTDAGPLVGLWADIA